MKLNRATYRDKVYACWIGKNIGGTMGSPYEGTHEILDINGFITDPSVVIPNDDLDLQLIWLYALENFGPHAINASLLGEHWISFIVPHWNEYGIGKVNMKRGLPPPLSGDYDNDWRNSNGAWIRTEIWATVAPAMPHVAAKYALEDASVDHGTGEGTYAAAFVAALQSSAFVLSDLEECIRVGLAAIPRDCRMTKSIDFLLSCRRDGMSWQEARNAVQKLNADIGNGWFEAPTNVAYAMIGLLWGEGDFKRSVITAINCGDDTDCTGATVGATLGILKGTSGIPADWRAHIGDEIVTISINKGNNGKNVPKSSAELTDRVAALAPIVLGAHSVRHSDWMYSGERIPHETVSLSDHDEIPENIFATLSSLAERSRREIAELRPFSVFEENVMMRARLSLDRAPDIAPNEEIGITLSIASKHCFEDEPRTLSLRWLLPDGFSAEGKRTLTVKAFNPHTNGTAEAHFLLRAGEHIEAKNRIVLEITADGRCTPLYLSLPLLG